MRAPFDRPGALVGSDPAAGAARACTQCRGAVAPDGFCTRCGIRQPSERDHYAEQPAGWVAGVCDRGLRRPANEDALALLADGAPEARAALVVLDGVSSSRGSAVASLAGARAAREALRALPLRLLGDHPAEPERAPGENPGEDVVAEAMRAVVAAAHAAVLSTIAADSPRPASTTFVAALVERGGPVSRLAVASLGDTRAYWLPDPGAGPDPLLGAGSAGVQVSVDDSGAQVAIEAGLSREDAERGPHAHAITRWLGARAPSLEPRLARLDLVGAGWVLVCSDGLWNYASSVHDLHRRVLAAQTRDPAVLADRLVGFARARGGHDNITVALARVEPTPGPPTDPPTDPPLNPPAGERR